MTKTKRQLRAEAVERLKANEPDNIYLAIHQAIGWSGDVLHTDEEWRDALIDLLTDDCDTECYECARLAELRAENNALREIVGNIEAPTDGGEASIASVEAFIEKQTEHEQDSREKLEADVKTELMAFGGYCANSLHHQVENADTYFDDFIALLDRQAAITERERERHWLEIVGASANCNLELTNRNAELQAKVDELEASLSHEREKNATQGARIMALQEGGETPACRACFDSMTQDYYTVKKQRDELRADVLELQAKFNEYERDFVKPLKEAGITEHAFGVSQVLANDVELIDEMKAKRDELEQKLELVLCHCTGGIASKAGIEASEMIAAIDENYERLHAEEAAELRKKVAELQSKLDEAKSENEALYARGNELYKEVDRAVAERDWWRTQFKKCLCIAIKQEDGENVGKLLTYPVPDDRIEPFQLVTDEIESLRTFYAETCGERDRYKELYLDESWHSGHQRMELAKLNARLNGYPEPQSKLLGKDGKWIKRGQTLYGEDGRAWKIERFDGAFLWSENDEKRLRPEWLTHEPSDSWESICADLRAMDVGNLIAYGNGDYRPDTRHGYLADRIEELAKEGA